MVLPTEAETKEALGGIKSMMKGVIADEEMFALSAQIMMKAYKALVTAGFSKRQAMQIVAGKGFTTGIK